MRQEIALLEAADAIPGQVMLKIDECRAIVVAGVDDATRGGIATGHGRSTGEDVLRRRREVHEAHGWCPLLEQTSCFP